MKKTLMIVAAMIFTVTVSFAADPPMVYVDWETNNCNCSTSSTNDYFKVTISIYDNANSTYVYSNYTRTTVNTSTEYIYFEVEDMLDYCHDSHPNTPSFTVTATVWLIETTPDPDVECCTGSGVETGDCRDFEADDIFNVSVGELE